MDLSIIGIIIEAYKICERSYARYRVHDSHFFGRPWAEECITSRPFVVLVFFSLSGVIKTVCATMIVHPRTSLLRNVHIRMYILAGILMGIFFFRAREIKSMTEKNKHKLSRKSPVAPVMDIQIL